MQLRRGISRLVKMRIYFQNSPLERIFILKAQRKRLLSFQTYSKNRKSKQNNPKS